MKASDHKVHWSVAALLAAGLTALAAAGTQAADRPAPRPPPRQAVIVPKPSSPKPLPRVPAEPSAAQRARLEAACARYRVVYGMDCPTENGSGVNGVDVLKDVRRLPLKEPARK